MIFDEMSINELINKTKDPSPNPGGGGITSLIGCLSSSLSVMAYNISKNKKSFLNLTDEIKEEIFLSIEDINCSIEKLKVYAIEDGKSFEGVLDALKLPKDTEEEKSIRKISLEKSYLKACEIPFLVSEELLKILEKQEILARYIDKIAISDIIISMKLNHAAIDAVLYNVSINLKGLNEEDRNRSMLMMKTIREESDKLNNKNLEIIEKRM